MPKKKKQLKKTKGKIIYGKTAEDRFKEIHGMTIQEWNAKQEEEFKTKTGMTPYEWYIDQVKTTKPIEFLKDSYGTITEDDVKLVKDLQVLGLKDDVINVLQHYVIVLSRIGVVHQLVREMGENWVEKDILTIEKAIAFVREEQEKYKESPEK